MRLNFVLRQSLVIVTTDGGFYRYQLMDQVEVVGFDEQLLLLRFQGKCDDTTDLVGEKLNAAHVQSVLEREFVAHQLTPTYFELFPQDANQPHYVLRIADRQLSNDKQLQLNLCESINAHLGSNPGYRYARDLGQLSCLQMIVITQEEAQKIDALRTARLLSSGIRHGNVKPSVLGPVQDPSQCLAGEPRTLAQD